MKILSIKDTGAPLVVFFAGWGMDENPFADYDADDCDFAVCYDYTTLDFDDGFISGKKIKRVVAWSFGVWAAVAGCGLCHALASAPERIAVNGTTTPVNDITGIPVKIFEGTLADFSAETLAKFERRMCGDKQSLEFYRARHPKRAIESLHAELTQMRNDTDASFFTHAIVGSQDAIFPPQNQLAAWAKIGNTQVTTVTAPHYSDAVLRKAVNGRF